MASALNLEYADYRGVPIEEAIEGVEEEAQLLVDIAEADWDTEEAEAVIEESIEAMGLTGPLDQGVAGLVLTISAPGGTPISSCNGGLIGGSGHRSEVPHILFTAPPDVMDRIIPAAMASEVGLIFNEVMQRHSPTICPTSTGWRGRFWNCLH